MGMGTVPMRWYSQPGNLSLLSAQRTHRSLEIALPYLHVDGQYHIMTVLDSIGDSLSGKHVPDTGEATGKALHV